jgi:hypothetical protein
MMEQVDHAAGKRGQRDIMMTTWRHDGEVLQVRVERDFYAHQSTATASVLTPDRKWTEIAAEPHTTWHANRTPLADVTRTLCDRAVAILGWNLSPAAQARRPSPAPGLPDRPGDL